MAAAAAAAAAAAGAAPVQAAAAAPPPPEQLRSLVQDCLAKHLYLSAVFYADKLVALTDYAPGDVYLLAQAYYVSRQHRRGVALLKRHGLPHDARFAFLTAQCLAAVGEWDELLQLLGDGGGGDAADGGDDAAAAAAGEQRRPGFDVATAAAVWLLRGRAFEALDNRARSAACFMAALRVDPFCQEALAALVDGHLLTNAQELELLEGLPLRPQDRWLGLLYRVRCKKHLQPPEVMQAQLAELQRPPASALQQQQQQQRDDDDGALVADQAPSPSPAHAARVGGAPSPAKRRAAVRPRVTPAKPPPPPPQAAQHRQQQQTRAQQTHTKQPQQQQPPSSARRRQGGSSTVSGGGGGGGGAAGGSAHALPSGDSSGGGGGGCGLGASADVLAARADWLLHVGRVADAHALTSAVLAADPYAAGALATHLAAALALGRKGELFLLAHRLGEEHPESSLTWLAVGCYHLAAKQPEAARRFFARATALDRGSAAAWVALGRASAELDEGDQALAAYRSAARLFPGLHAPLLGMGCAYGRMGNLALCERCLLQAHALCPHDPAVAHELGALAYRTGQHEAAARWLARALKLLPGGAPTPAWEATVVGLAHALRKLKQYGRAAELYEDALGLNPHSAAAHAGLAFTRHLQGDSAAAAAGYHRALGLRPDDAFAAEMLGLCLRDEVARLGLGAEEALAREQQQQQQQQQELDGGGGELGFGLRPLL